MKASNALWKARLAGSILESLSREIDIYETEMDLRKRKG